MAKWGEGDPRWIVEERPDATNVNNWHWTEKNASYWSRDKLTELLTNIEVSDSRGTCKIVDMPRCEGEAVANNRKAKLIFFYEWIIELKWQGEPDDSDEPIEGKVEIPNLSEEHDPSDVDVTVTVSSKGDKAEALKELMRSKGTQIIRQRLEAYISALKQEFSQGMILPTKSDSINQVKSTGKTTVNYKQTVCSHVNSPYDFLFLMWRVSSAQAEEFYRALTVKEMVQAFSQSPCVLEAKNGGRFELFGGNVSGTFLELVMQCIAFLLKLNAQYTWPIPSATLQMCSGARSEEGVPQGEADRTREGWQRHYWDSMKRTFGFGALLL
ncbi:hypothetical protein HPB50_021237 [Hyalomma asiaticum]|uniref:Uncharacterized protein n=1 Tax=Hyalomma asiaticum TaxID=266040 RepID=A0ACB7RZ83_HYAAI|nr:hypothetical protein HPB50_021237 [Hyalomma asiaticum]